MRKYKCIGNIVLTAPLKFNSMIKLNDDDILRKWNELSKLWKQSEKQNWFHEYILIPYFLNFISKNSWKNILDYGCGTGELLVSLEELSISIHGYEPAINLSKTAQKKTKSLLFNDNKNINQKYDLIILNLVLSSILNYKDTISGLKLLLKDDGILIISLPHPCFALESKYHSTTQREWLAVRVYDENELYFKNPVQKIYWDDSKEFYTYIFYRTIAEYQTS